MRHLIPGQEKKANYEKGAAVDLTAEGGATDRDNSANLLLARQSPGYVIVKNLIADLVQERGDAAMLDIVGDARRTATKSTGSGTTMNPKIKHRATSSCT